jgi:hypothetical protein
MLKDEALYFSSRQSKSEPFATESAYSTYLV